MVVVVRYRCPGEVVSRGLAVVKYDGERVVVVRLVDEEDEPAPPRFGGSIGGGRNSEKREIQRKLNFYKESQHHLLN